MSERCANADDYADCQGDAFVQLQSGRKLCLCCVFLMLGEDPSTLLQDFKGIGQWAAFEAKRRGAEPEPGDAAALGWRALGLTLGGLAKELREAGQTELARKADDAIGIAEALSIT